VAAGAPAARRRSPAAAREAVLPAAAARVSQAAGDTARLSPEAATARLEALGFADPRGALRHLEAMTAGLSRRAGVLRTMLPVMLGWFADAHDPDAGLLAFRQVSEALGDSPWFLALLRDSDVEAERLARLLSASRYVADLLGRAPEAVSIIARDDELTARDADALRAEQAAVVRRHADAETAVARGPGGTAARAAACGLCGPAGVHGRRPGRPRAQ
jgi:glutamate-ammonia-ligase adenylyltransferase